jgi:hypothetical protein
MLTTGFKVSKYELVNVIVPANDSKNEYYFPDLPNLRDAQVKAMSVYQNGVVAIDPNGISNMTVADLDTAFLVLNINDKEDIKIPMSSLCALQYTATPANNRCNFNGYLPFAGQVIRWPKSYVKFPVGHDTIQFSINIGVFYK